VAITVPADRNWPRSTWRRPAGERRAQGLLVDDRLLLGDLGLEIAQVGLVVVDDRLADGPRLEQLDVAVVGDLGKLRRRLERLQLGDLVLAAQPQQDLAGLHLVARLEQDLLDDARHFERQVGTAHGAQAADGVDRGLPIAGLGLGGRDGLGRVGHAGHGFLDLAVDEDLEAEQASQDHAE
jgi:hypothetical protein